MPTPTLKDQTNNLDPYTHLAEFYEKAGFSRFGAEMIPNIILWAQQNDWIGRRILDLGSGTGAAVLWLAHQGFRVIGVDSSNAMLVKAKLNAQTAGLGISWRQQDIRELEYSDNTLDMVVSLNTLNHMRGLQDMARVFVNAHRVLLPDKLFIFDLQTVEGLAQRWGTDTHILFDDRQSLNIIARTAFSYETLSNAVNYIIYYRDENNTWQRVEETHLLLGFGIREITTLLKKAGFGAIRVMDVSLRPLETETGVHRAIFIAHKPAAPGN
ncbi:MAG: class I SAM-dependent methyltransferase [Anaerolineae bacterium]|nr:class I SAM-dependent methyltransferase [Anaerolineae bacterium]